MSKRSRNCLLVFGGGFNIPAFLVVLDACRAALRYGFLDVAVVAAVVVGEVDGWVVFGGAGFGVCWLLFAGGSCCAVLPSSVSCTCFLRL